MECHFKAFWSDNFYEEAKSVHFLDRGRLGHDTSYEKLLFMRLVLFQH